MIKFEIGVVYGSRSICDHNCIFEIETISRTEKSLTYKYEGQVRRSVIKLDSEGNEYVQPEHYSMAPIFRASRPLSKMVA